MSTHTREHYGGDAEEYAEPRCPRCGSSQVREWDLVPVPYDLAGIAADGTLDAEGGSESPAWDGCEFEELRCRDCDYASADVGEFRPGGVEVETTEPEARRDRKALDNIAAFMNRPGQWNGGDVCQFVAEQLVRSGRELLDNADE